MFPQNFPQNFLNQAESTVLNDTLHITMAGQHVKQGCIGGGSFLSFRNRDSGTGDCSLLMLPFEECRKLGISFVGSAALYDSPNIWETESRAESAKDIQS